MEKTPAVITAKKIKTLEELIPESKYLEEAGVEVEATFGFVMKIKDMNKINDAAREYREKSASKKADGETFTSELKEACIKMVEELFREIYY